MKDGLGPGTAHALLKALRPLISVVSLSALVVAAGGLSAPSIPANAQELGQPPRPDPDGEYGDDLEPFEAEGPLIAVVSIGNQNIRLFDRNGLVADSKVSTGRNGHNTPEGVFSIIERKVEHNSNLYDDAEMPFMQRITWSGVALHEGVVPGYRASHGCIRLPNGFAERFFRTTRIGTRVVIASHDVTPQTLTHRTLPQPGDPPAAPAPEAGTGPRPSPLLAPDHAGLIEIAATSAEADKALRQLAPAPAPQKPAPSLAELRARRAVVERKLAAATKAVNQARLPVRPRLVEQGKAEKALRQAIALANRAEGRARVLGEAALETETDAAWTDAVAAHIDALIELTRARTRLEDAREIAAQKTAAAMAVQDHVKKLLAERQTVLNEFRAISRRLAPVTIFVSRAAGRVFVHQAFHPVMDVPIEIASPDRPLGTHVFTALQSEENDDAVRWVGMTLATADGSSPKATGSRKGRHTGEDADHVALRGARQALDRIELPQRVLARIMPTLQPGSTLIVSDLEKSIESGPGTDVIVQTKGEAEAARSIAEFVARKRAEQWGDDNRSGSSQRRVRTGDWSRW
ncbi:MAG: L,D-transpeptidase family protein [Hyphomicrobiaceae bacterium]